MSRVDHVVAQFGGRERVFRYPRSSGLTNLNPHMREDFSPYAAFQRFGLGQWTFEDLVRVLSPKSDPFGLYRPSSEITDVLIKNGPGNYAPLAARVLEAGLFGIAAEAAVFDEREPFKGAA